MMPRSQEHLPAPNAFTLHTTRLIADLGLRALGGLNFSGEENIKDITGAYIQSATHRSMLDIPATGVSAYRADQQQLYYVAKKELDLPGVGTWLEGSGTMFIDRRVGFTLEDLNRIGELIKQRAAFAVMPEGHRNHGPLQRKHLKSMIIAPMAFEHGLPVVPVGIAGTEPGDIGFFEVVYGPHLLPEKVGFEADPQWDAKRRLAKLTKTIGREAIDGFMESLYLGMSTAYTEALQRRDERMARRPLSRTILLPLNIKAKARPPLDLK